MAEHKSRTPVLHTNQRPLSPPDMAAKLYLIPEMAAKRGWIIVKWWKPIDAKDPALKSLGTGMMTITVGRAVRLENQVLEIEAPEQTLGAPQPFTSKIAVADIIDFHLAGETPVTDAMIRKLVHADE
jgi:hypothetical protein